MGEEEEEEKVAQRHQMVSGSLALLYFLVGFHGGRQGSGPDRGRSPVEWGDFPSVRPSVRSSPPLGHPAGPEAQPARPEAQPARPKAQPARPEAQPARPEAQPASQPSSVEKKSSGRRRRGREERDRVTPWK